MRASRGFLAFLLLITLLIPSTLNVLASNYTYRDKALVLHELGLYQGGSNSYFDPDLGSSLQRQSAIILLVRLFGEEKSALSMTPAEVNNILSKYTDSGQLAAFARPYMAYAIKNGMTNGTSTTTLGPAVLIDSPSFACMILRNMGYSVDKPAFTHSPDILGSLAGVQLKEISAINYKILIRDDVVGMMYWALKAAAADGFPLIIRLIRMSAVNPEIAVKNGLAEYDAATGTYRLPVPPPPPVTDRDVIYGEIRKALLKASPSVILPANTASGTIDDVTAVIKDVLADNPNILYYTGITFWPGSRLVELKYSKDAATIANHTDSLDKKVSSIVSSLIKPDMLDYQKELAIHDYLVNNCVYDQSSSAPPESYTAYGALCLGTAVCEGYSKAMQVLLNAAGVECLTVSGTAKDRDAGQGHSWNIVRIYGQHYHVDSAWDDLIMQDGSNILTHVYFNLSDSEISRDHMWDASSSPACGGTICNYYDYNGFIAKTYTDFITFVKNKYNQGIRNLSLKISDTRIPAFDVNAAIAEIQKATHANVVLRPIDIYGTVDLVFK